MEDDESLERFCLADRPRLVTPPLVHLIHEHDSRRIEGSYGEWNADVEETVKDGRRDREGLQPSLLPMGSGQRVGDARRRELEKACRREAEMDLRFRRCVHLLGEAKRRISCFLFLQ